MEAFNTQFFLTLLHLLGVAVGVSGAFFGDMLFFSATKNGIVSAPELRLLTKAGKFVWTGLIILIISGAFLFFLDPDKYMASTKFLSKMFVVLVITINGVVFHRVHLPKLHRLLGVKLRDSSVFRKASTGMFISGAVSVVSWLCALALGSLRSLSFSIPEILFGYGSFLVVACAGALLMRSKFLKS